MANKQALKIDQLSRWTMLLTWKLQGVRVNLAGCTAQMQIRNKVGGYVLLDLSTENDRIVLQTKQDAEGSTIGTIHVIIEADDTADLTVYKGVYDLVVFDAGGVPHRLQQGSVTFNRAVTGAG